MTSAIMDPTGQAPRARPRQGWRWPRAAPTLSGATVGLLENGKQNARLFLEEVAGVLRERYGVGEVDDAAQGGLLGAGAARAGRRDER